jgi:hypothetical protein
MPSCRLYQTRAWLTLTLHPCLPASACACLCRSPLTLVMPRDCDCDIGDLTYQRASAMGAVLMGSEGCSEVRIRSSSSSSHMHG